MNDGASSELGYRGETSPRLFVVAAFLNVLVPGLGHLYCGRPRRALRVYGATACVLLGGALLAVAVGLFLPRAALIALAAWLLLQAGLLGSVHRMTRGTTREASGDYVLQSYNHPAVYAAMVAVLGVAPLWLTALAFSDLALVDIVVADRNSFPELRQGDRVYGPRLGSWSRAPQRGELVVVEDVASEPTVLRVLGIPGDEVGVEDGVPIVNGSPLFREHLGKPESSGAQGAPSSESLSGLVAYREHVARGQYEVFEPAGVEPVRVDPLQLGSDEYYLLADLRGVEKVKDSRRQGPIPADKIIGRPLFVWSSRSPLDGSIRWSRIGLRLH